MLPGRNLPHSPPLLVDDNKEYEVDCILDYKVVRGSPRWLVQWKSYPLGRRYLGNQRIFEKRPRHTLRIRIKQQQTHQTYQVVI